MSYTVTITSSDGNKNTYSCGGGTDQEALVYAGKVVEEKADPSDPQATITIEKDGREIGVPAVVADMIKRAV